MTVPYCHISYRSNELATHSPPSTTHPLRTFTLGEILLAMTNCCGSHVLNRSIWAVFYISSFSFPDYLHTTYRFQAEPFSARPGVKLEGIYSTKQIEKKKKEKKRENRSITMGIQPLTIRFIVRPPCTECEYSDHYLCIHTHLSTQRLRRPEISLLLYSV